MAGRSTAAPRPHRKRPYSMTYLPTLIISMFITLILIPFFRKMALKMNAVDIPNERKVHSAPMPKTGGISMAIAVLIPVLLWKNTEPFILSVLFGAVIIVSFGLMDDIRDLGYRTKFTGQILAALIVILFGGLRITRLGALMPEGAVLSAWISIPLTLLVMVGVTNAINLSDGLDGLAGGITLLTFICIGYMADGADNVRVALLSAAMAGGLFGFLRFNTHPATVFMGDAGSQFLGFMAVTLSLSLTQGNPAISPMVPLLLLGFPVLDTLTVMMERAASGRSPFVADKNHFHHKLMRLRLNHTEAVLAIYFIQSALVTFAFVFRYYSEWFLLLVYWLFSGLILAFFFVADKKGWQPPTGFRPAILARKKIAELKEKKLIIKSSFKIVEFATPVLLMITCFLPARIPAPFAWFSLFWALILFAARFVQKRWSGFMVRLVFYLIAPFLMYLSEADRVVWASGRMLNFYNFAFVLLVLFVILTLKFTKRKKGFKSSTMDFLILFIALVVPNLPDQRILSYDMGLIAARIIVLFFSFEVLIGEMRGELVRVSLPIALALMVVGIRGFVL